MSKFLNVLISAATTIASLAGIVVYTYTVPFSDAISVVLLSLPIVILTVGFLVWGYILYQEIKQ